MKKTFIFSALLLANVAQAQEEVLAETMPFYQDKTFLMLAGGALLLIVILIGKKVVDNKSYQEEENNEDSNL